MSWAGWIATWGVWLSITTTHQAGAPAASLPGTSAAATHAAVANDAGHAPDFDFATSYGWRKFSDLHRERAVLLVFEADETTLATIERETARFAGQDVEVAAVTSGNDGANWELLEKLGLTYRLLSDPSGHVASLFGFTHPTEGRAVSAWCLVDRGGRILETHQGIEAAMLAGDVEEAIGAVPATADGQATR